MDDDALSRGRKAYERRAWSDAYRHLCGVAEHEPLAAADLERLAVAAYLTGRSDAATAAFERLHHVLLADGDVRGSTRWAIWLGILLLLAGNHAQGGGWLSRAERLLEKAALDCPERGLLLLPPALAALDAGETQRALALCEQMSAIAERFADDDLLALGILGLGQARIAAGDIQAGVTRLDEAMIAVTTGDVSPIIAGIAYCAMIISCRDVFDLRRAQEWTAALSRWCTRQQDLRPYRGQCLIHRSEILQLRGQWSEALAEVEHACTHLGRSPVDPAIGMARYQQAELLRLRGQFDRAEQAYRQASEWGHSVQPGLALLRLAQGRIDEAVPAIRREIADCAADRVRRARVLPAYVEVLVAAGDLDGARAAVDELETLAADFGSDYLQAVAAEARGTVLLAADDATGACGALRRAWRAWQALDAPYEAARARVRLGQGYRQVGDHDTARVEIDAARRVFAQLGATPALARAGPRAAESDPAPGGLTPREVEVLRLVATGTTNRQIADDLVISEKTVARHLSNIFAKLGVPSRAAATAWAYDHHLR